MTSRKIPTLSRARSHFRGSLITLTAVWVVASACTPTEVAKSATVTSTPPSAVATTSVPPTEDVDAVTGYVDLEARFVSVEALMTYSGSSQPLVPASSLVETDNAAAVFTIVDGPAERDGYWHFTVSLQPVTVTDRTADIAFVTVGLTGCDQVIIDPPSAMTDQMKVRTTWQREDENLDLGALFFSGSPPAPIQIWGGIARQADDEVQIVWTHTGPTPPDGSTYQFETPDGLVRTIVYRIEVRIWVSISSLRPDQPTGTVLLVDPEGRTIYQAALLPFC